MQIDMQSDILLKMGVLTTQVPRVCDGVSRLKDVDKEGED